MSNNNLNIPGGSTVDILLETSTSFMAQNTSDFKIGFKLKASADDVSGGELGPGEVMKFAESITVWTLNKANASPDILVLL